MTAGQWRIRRWAGLFALLLASQLRAGTPVRQDLGGKWELSDAGKKFAGPASVPGGVHLDLLAAGKIPDAFVGDNAASLKWIPETTWQYSRTFTPTAELLERKQIVLRCEGLDTIATVTLNGQEIGRADNMFRTWEFDVTQTLKSGPNQLTVVFTPWKDYVRTFAEQAKGKGPNTAMRGIANVRKALYSNGWDFAAQLPSIGIDQPISLVGYDVAKLQGVAFDTQVEPGKTATVTVRPQLSPNAPAGLKIRITASLNGRPVATAFGDAQAAVDLTIVKPELWWPNGMGERPMYSVAVDLLGNDNAVLDRVERRIGLRKIELLRPDVPKPRESAWPATDNPLRLIVNGRPVFARGASWVPSDMFLTRATPDKLRTALADAAGQNMNFIRTWGGGYYEPDAFYDACDELGLMVWHDFKFACHGYPGRNEAFAENLKQEITQQTTRLSSHPSIAVWCGNNEIDAIVKRYGVMSQADYDYLFVDIIGGGLKQLVPNANYVTGSPDEGDEHNWWVWHVGADFEKYRESHGWMTEFGFQSFPVPATVAAFTAPADRESVLSPVMKAHQQNGNQRGNEMILNQIDRYFRKPKDFESTLWLSQINQAYGLAIGIEHWRSDWPRSRGAFTWQLNDSWPCASWSLVDYFGRWKAAMYTAKAKYGPALVTGVYDQKSQTLPLKICSDDPHPFTADVSWTITTAAGGRLVGADAQISVPPGTTAVAGPTLKLGEAIAKAKADALLVWVNVKRDGKLIATNLLLTARPKAMALEDPKLKVAVVPAGDGFDVRLSASKPALWAFAELKDDPDARWGDNFVHIAADGQAVLHVKPSKAMTLEDVRNSIIVRSLFDLTESGPLAAAKP